MTDEQIIKAVGICRTQDTCRGCPYHTLYTAKCVSSLMKDVFDLINRLKAKNEREINQIKSEAIKEFAERLKKSDEFYDCIRAIASVSKIDCLIDTFDKLVKEMTEVQK